MPRLQVGWGTCTVRSGAVLTPIQADPSCTQDDSWQKCRWCPPWTTIFFMPTAKPQPSIYRLKITLLEIEPATWRRIQVSSTMPLCCLHDAFQAVLGWTDSHLHQFEKDGKYWGVPYDDGFGGDVEVIDESIVPVAKLLLAEGEAMVYVYDFGDNWRHQVVLENSVPADAPTKPVCLGGERRCPPEGCRRAVRLSGIPGGHLRAGT